MEALELPALLMSKWLRAPITGCLFAEAIAKKPDISAVRLSTVRKAVGDAAFPDLIHASLLQAAAEPAAALLVFPNLRVDEDIADLVSALVKHKDFTITKKEWPAEVTRTEILFLLEWKTPSGYPSRTMGFAPSGSMPVTRRAPFVSLMVWPGKHDNKFRPTNYKSVGVVDMKHNLDQTKYDKLWNESLEQKAKRDKEEPSTSASFRDVTFCLSERVAGRLGFA
jgi:hypothetical protein